MRHEAYVEALLAEMRLAAHGIVSGYPLESIYFGGGTPSLLRPGLIERLLRRAEDLFGLAEHCEITLEANPGATDREKLDGYRTAGVNRLSMGVQSFDDRMLATLERIHTARQARDFFHAARRSGFSNIGIDLINALPCQTLEMWRHDLCCALELSPEHLSVYGLTIEEDTPFASRYPNRGDHDDDRAADMFEAADETLTEAGFEHYEIANYARPGFRSRHNCGYWRRDGYLGLGCGAHSLLRTGFGIRFGNTPDLDEYTAAITNGILPRLDEVPISRYDAMAEFMFLGLRMADGVFSSDFEREFGIPLRERYGEEMEKLARLELLTVDMAGARLTGRGMLLSNQVFSRFLV